MNTFVFLRNFFSTIFPLSLKKDPDKELEPNSMTIADPAEPLFTNKVDVTDNVTKNTTSRKKGKDRNIENLDTSGNDKKKKKPPKRKNPAKEMTELKGKGKKKKLDKTKPDSNIDETDKIKEEPTVMVKPLPKEEIMDNGHTTSDVSLTNDIHIRRTYNIPKTCKCELKGMMVCITCGSYSHLPCTSNTGGQCLNCVVH